MVAIGPYTFDTPLILAPMAGVTDQPFRKICRRFGASLCVSEMVIADPSFWKTRKSKHRLDHRGESGPISVQIAGGEPEMLAEAARLNQERGAQIIDINMGCPAKKVCNKAAGSALMKDEKLVANILKAVVAAVSVPVTLKTRTGWNLENKNVHSIARIAQEEGISALAVHGRTRECAYKGNAEYDSIAKVKQDLSIPVFANGDITSPEKAKFVLEYTKTDGLLIGRGAQGNPWIFDQIRHYLDHGSHLPEVSAEAKTAVVLEHVRSLHQFYGELMGVRIARKHVSWYLAEQDKPFRKHFNALQNPEEQLKSIQHYFSESEAIPSEQQVGQDLVKHSSSFNHEAAEIKPETQYTHIKKEEKAA